MAFPTSLTRNSSEYHFSLSVQVSGLSAMLGNLLEQILAEDMATGSSFTFL